jgi:hypothetical protein
MDETQPEKRTIKPADFINQVVEIVGGREVTGKYGMQFALRTADGHVAYVSTKTGIAKGLLNGKLKASAKTPLRLVGTHALGADGPICVWDLAPRVR